MPNHNRTPLTLVVGATLMFTSLSLLNGCTEEGTTEIPTELVKLVPERSRLRLSIPGRRGEASSGSAAVFNAVARVNRELRGLDLLQAYFDDGGEANPDVSLVIAVGSVPRVADQAIRYSQPSSRLDVELVANHAFYYLQYDGGQGFDPDTNITTAHMLVEGSTVPTTAFGELGSVADARGLASRNAGYARLYFNRRIEDANETHDAVQLDYRFTDELTTRHLTYFLRKGVASEGTTRGLVQFHNSDGSGFIMQSETENEGSVFSWLAQYRNDGSMAVWKGDGSVWSCHSADGTEIGNVDAPGSCSEFSQAFPAPPKLPSVWPGLPSGVPR